jgi:hypothetical protein
LILKEGIKGWIVVDVNHREKIYSYIKNCNGLILSFIGWDTEDEERRAILALSDLS